MRITANKIDEWANTTDCRTKLPLLIRKLIYESINDLSRCKFPSLEQTTSSSGFDGILESNEKTQYIPKGISVWEMGCNIDKKGKADEDYDKRKNNPLDTNPKETVYIQVSPRKWKDEKIKEWCNEKNQDKFWKKVILLDAKDLEEWINNTPNVEQWFAEELNLPNEGIQTLNQWWKKWSSVNQNIQFTSDLILTNKENESKDLQNYLKTSKYIIVKSSTIEESIAFLYSVIDKFPLTQREYYLNKVLIIDDERSFDFYSQYDLILIPTFDFVYNANVNSFVYIPLSTEDNTQENILLKDLIKFDLMNCLNENMGIPNDLARKYANECGGNINILRYILSPKSQKPLWFSENLIQTLITTFIVQSWDENNLNDLKIIEKISGLTYEQFSQKLMLLLNKPNNPLIKNQNIWILKSPQYLFFLIAPYLTKYDINNLYNSFLKVFKISKYNDSLLKENYSMNLKKGISKSIILIDLYGNKSNLNCNSIKTWKLIEEMFENENELFWIYNSQYLPLIAEISPEFFIKELKKTLTDNKKYIESLFNTPNYTYLLSSLELCSRDPREFNSVVEILIELNNIKYSNNFYNSPFNSLKELFIPWVNHNSSFLFLRLNKLNEILIKNKEVGWKLLEFLLSRQSNVSHGIEKPTYRNFATMQKPLKQKIDDYNSKIEENSIIYLDDDVEKYRFLIKQHPKTQNSDYKQRIIEKLENYEDSDNFVIIWNELLDLVCWMKRINTKREKFSKNDIELLEKISKKFEPTNIIERSEWAFDKHTIRTSKPNIIESMRNERKNIIANLIKEKGFEGIETLIKHVKLPELLGNYVSEYEFDEEVLKLLNTDENNDKFVNSYIRNKSFKNFNWTKQTFEKIKSEDNEYLIKFFIFIYPNEKNWELLNRCHQQVIDGYWIQCNSFSYESKEGIMNHINKLIEYSRFSDAVESLAHYLDKLDTSYIGDTLFSISEKIEKIENYYLDTILEHLHETNYERKKLMKLEFGFSEYYMIEKPNYPLIIHEEIVKNTDLFCCLIKNLYNENPLYVYRSTSILDSMSIIPGLDDNNNIDVAFLREWINKCEIKLKDSSSFYLYYYLANLFANTPEESENWPQDEICQIIDGFNNDILTNEFSVAISNKRGLIVKDIFEGGNEEISLADKYQKYANKIIYKYPITAKALINASESFYGYANWQDYMAINNNWRF